MGILLEALQVGLNVVGLAVGDLLGLLEGETGLAVGDIEGAAVD